MNCLKSLVVALVAASFSLTLVDAKVIYVNAAAAGGAGNSWAAAYRFLQDALAQTIAGDEVWVAAGTYYPDDGAAITAGDRTATFTLKQDVKLYGGFAGGETSIAQRNPVTNVTVLSGEIWTEKLYWSLHVVTLAGSATLDGLTVTKGNANGGTSPNNNGAGIYAASISQIMLANCLVSNNSAASSGGAIYASSPPSSSSSVSVINCTFSGNTSLSGGAIYCYSSSSTSSSNVTAADSNC